MSPETEFNLGLVGLVGSVMLYGTATIARFARKSRESRRELYSLMRAHGFDPDVPTLRTVAQLQAQERPGWHPIERITTRMTIRAWKRTP